MRGAIQTIAVMINFRKSNKNPLERRDGAYRSSRKKSSYTKHTWSSSIMKQQEQPFILVVLPTSDFRSFCKYNMKLSCYHIFSTDNIVSYLQPFLIPPFSGSDKFLHKFWAFRMSFHFKYKFSSKHVLLFLNFFLQRTKISLVPRGRAGRIVFCSRK
jgi:hypothetical protein